MVQGCGKRSGCGVRGDECGAVIGDMIQDWRKQVDKERQWHKQGGNRDMGREQRGEGSSQCSVESKTLVYQGRLH